MNQLYIECTYFLHSFNKNLILVHPGFLANQFPLYLLNMQCSQDKKMRTAEELAAKCREEIHQLQQTYDNLMRYACLFSC